MDKKIFCAKSSSHIYFQHYRRVDDSLEFESKTWNEYENGFDSGDIERGSLWLGNERIHILSRRNVNDDNVALRIELDGYAMTWPGEKGQRLFKDEADIHLYGRYNFSVKRYSPLLRLSYIFLVKLRRYRTEWITTHCWYRNRLAAIRVIARAFVTVNITNSFTNKVVPHLQRMIDESVIIYARYCITLGNAIYLICNPVNQVVIRCESMAILCLISISLDRLQ